MNLGERNYQYLNDKYWDLLIGLNLSLATGATEGINFLASRGENLFYFRQDGVIVGFLLATEGIPHDYIKAANYPGGVCTLAAYVNDRQRDQGISKTLLDRAEAWMGEQTQSRGKGAFVSPVHIPSSGRTDQLYKAIRSMFLRRGYREAQSGSFVKEFS